MILRNVFRFPQKNSAKKRLALSQVLHIKRGRFVPTWGQIMHFPKLLSSGEQKLLIGALAVTVVAGAALAWQLLGSIQTTVARVGGEYTEGLVGSPQLVNPLYAVSGVDADLAVLLYNGLMRYDSKDGLVTDLAESYTISEDGKVYQFVLRSDAKWHDGKPVTAKDVLFTFNSIQNPEYLSAFSGVFSGVTIEVLEDGRTIQLTRTEALAPFLSYLTIGILPSHLWQNIPPASALTTELNIKPIGSGPYAFEKLTKDTGGVIRTYELKRNTDYHLGAPFISQLHFKFYSSLTAAVEALRNNNVQGISYLPITDFESFEKRSGITISSPTIPQYNAIFINENADTVLESSVVRKAVAHAIDKDALVRDALGDKANPVNSFILPGMLGEHPELATLAFDQTKAIELLEADGWKVAEGAQIRTKGEVGLRFTLTVINAPELVLVAETLKEQLLAIGLDMQIAVVDAATFQSETLKTRAYDAVLSGELYTIDADPYAFWHSSQSQFPNLNLSGFVNRKADELIEAGRKETNPETRAKNYRDLQDIVAEEMPAIFLYQPQYLYPHTSKLTTQNLERIATSQHRFSNVHEWYIKIKRQLHLPKKAQETVDAEA